MSKKKVAKNYGAENWLHSRTSSKKNQRNKLLKLYNKSKEQKYAGIRWTGKKDQILNEFADEVDIKYSRMQSMINAYTRLGYLEDKKICPLKLTTLGVLWYNLNNKGLKKYANSVEELMITSALATYAFDSEMYNKVPYKNYRPLYELLRQLDSNGFISSEKLRKLIVGKQILKSKNLGYWKTDLIRSGLFSRVDGGLKRTKKFKSLTDAVLSKKLSPKITEDDWSAIHDNVLYPKNPYYDEIIDELDKILEEILKLENFKLGEELVNSLGNIIENSCNTESIEINNRDYKVPDSYSKTKIRKKQSAWSKIVKDAYGNKCCVTKCDINLDFLLEAAHIKDYSAEEIGEGHRANPKNGLCLCTLCHALFDKGYFTLKEDYTIEISEKLENIEGNRIRDILMNSNNLIINPLPSTYRPAKEFIKYHREKHGFKI